MQQALIIHRPARQFEIAKTDVNPAACGRNQAAHRPRGTHQLCGRLFPVARIQTEHQISITKYILVHAHIERMTTGEIKAAVDIKNGSAYHLRQHDQIVEPVCMAPHVFGENNRALRLQQHLGNSFQHCRVGRQRARYRHRACRWQQHIMLEWRLLQPCVIAHVNRALRLGHHHPIGAGK